MPACPMCNKPLRELTRKCPTCQADLDLLVDYASGLQGGLQRAENLARSGELGQALWAYLEVLEVDPDNPAARKQIGQVVTAVRQFDTQSALRKMAEPSNNGAAGKKPLSPETQRALIFGGAFVLVFALGVILGFILAGGAIGVSGGQDNPVPEKNETLGGSILTSASTTLKNGVSVSENERLIGSELPSSWTTPYPEGVYSQSPGSRSAPWVSKSRAAFYPGGVGSTLTQPLRGSLAAA